MRPESQRRPTDGLESRVRIRISLAVGLDLLPPELGVSLRPRGMFWATVPEAAIDEDCDLATGECHVRDAARFLQHLIADPVAQADALHLAPQRQLCIRTRLPDLRHAATGIG